MVVQLQIVHQCGLQIGPAIEAGLLQQFIDATVEALDHAVRLRGPRRHQAMLGRYCGASTSKACWPLGFLSLVAKRSVNCEPSPVRILLILMGEASFGRRRKSTLLLSVMSP